MCYIKYSKLEAQISNSQHLHFCSLVLAYTDRSWLRVTLPSSLNTELNTELFVATGTNSDISSVVYAKVKTYPYSDS